MSSFIVSRDGSPFLEEGLSEIGGESSSSEGRAKSYYQPTGVPDVFGLAVSSSTLITTSVWILSLFPSDEVVRLFGFWFKTRVSNRM